jgi:putative molybdopterin biosynthesis protein
MPQRETQRLQPLAYSPAQVADVLNVTRMTVYNEIKRGNLPSFKIGRAVRIPADAVNKMIGAGA